jgi:hypothetical protein
VEETHPTADGHQVGRDIEGTGHDQHDQQGAQNYLTHPLESSHCQSPETATRCQRHAITDLLNPDHQRQGEESSPKQSQAKPSADLCIGGDSRGIIV